MMASQTQTPLTRLECPNCGSPIDQLNATSQATVCPTCGSYISIGVEAPEVLSRGQRLPDSPRPIKMGDRVTIASIGYTVLGRVVYSGTSEGESFSWNEWLLGGEDGRMVWLGLDETGFSLFRKIRFRRQFNAHSDSRLQISDDKQAVVHERYPAVIVGVEGELTWRAKPGDQFFVAEASGKGGLKYSIQQTNEELEIYEGRQIDEKALARAFRNEEWLKKLENVAKWRNTYNTVAIICAVAVVIGLLAAFIAGNTGVTEDPERVTLSQNNLSANFPVNLTTERPVVVSIQLVDNTLPQNSFIDVDVTITSPDGLTQPLFVQELWHETGRDEDGPWVETQYKTSEMFVPRQVGEHKLEVAYDGSVLNRLTLEVSIRRDHIMPLWFFIYAGVTGGLAFLFFIMASSQKLPS
ncbi:MAG: DUF4178 domain-containing protein [Anaerolineae bacterium]